MSRVFDLKTRLAEMSLAPKKAFGQNFLVSGHVIDKILACVRARKFSELVEIGPGLGALTEPLLDYKPRLFEFDDDLVQYWRGRGLTVEAGDAIRLNWEELQLDAPTLLVSNLPYQIATHLVIDRCFGPAAIGEMILMFQKEVAQRLMAEPRSKGYGFLAVMAQLHFHMARVVDAAPGDFFPAPKVAGRVLFFKRLPDPDLGLRFLKFVKQGFAFRRKFLLKNLKSVVDPSKLARMPGLLIAMDLTEKARAEELTPAQFVELFKKVYEH